MAAHPAIDKWARKKFKDTFGGGDWADATFRVEQETYSRGYCETCGYDEEVVEIFVKQPGQKERLLTSITTDLATIMQEILDVSMETN